MEVKRVNKIRRISNTGGGKFNFPLSSVDGKSSAEKSTQKLWILCFVEQSGDKNRWGIFKVHGKLKLQSVS